jgi:hypothetical protein
LTLSVLETLGSGLPYGAVGPIDARPYVTNPPAYVTPQGSSSELYYFTNRDAYRTQGFSRADFSASYNHAVTGGARKVEVFAQAQVLNILNQQDLCGCGQTVFGSGGILQLNTVSGGTPGQGVVTLAPFNPFTTTPVQGVNWNTLPAFGTAVNRFAYDSPRMFRVSFGVRF